MTFIAYSGTLQNGFVSLDDPSYITDNYQVLQGLSWDGIKWAFEFHASNWHPLTWMSHMLDVSLFDKWAAGHHLTSLLLHIANALLLFCLLRYTTGRLWASAFAAALFALHPLHVESVAWASERKDVLSTFFFLATILAYARYARSRSWQPYLLVAILYALGLASKPMLVTLPIVLLLMDYWPLERLWTEKGVRPRESGSPEAHPISQEKGSDPIFRKLILEKLPFAIMAAASAIITLVAQKSAMVTTEQMDLATRVTNAIVSYWRYIAAMLWPAGLAAYYPRPLAPMYWQAAVVLVILAAITVFVLAKSRKYKYLPAGWLWYLVTLVPVIGLVQVGQQSHADRYTYIPLIGLFIAIAWAGADMLRAKPSMRFALPAVAIIALIACGMMTWRTTGFWRDDLSLCDRAIAVTKDNFTMLTNRGFALIKRGQFKEAMADASESLRLQPEVGRTQSLMGVLLMAEGKPEEALVYCVKGAESLPNAKTAQLNVAWVLYRLGRYEEALQYCQKAISLDPHWATAYETLARTQGALGRYDEAEKNMREAVRLEPENVDYHGALAFVLDKLGRRPEAIAELHKALAIDPDNKKANDLLKDLDASGQ